MKWFGTIGLALYVRNTTSFFVLFFGGLEYVGHSFAYVAHFIFPRILRRRLNTFRVFSVDAERMKNKNEEYAERNILSWKGLVPLRFKILGKSNLRDIYGHK
jgi:hypothetical protein